MDKKLLTGILVLCSLYVGFVIYACTKIYIDDKDMSNIDLIAAYDSDKYLTKSTDFGEDTKKEDKKDDSSTKKEENKTTEDKSDTKTDEKTDDKEDANKYCTDNKIKIAKKLQDFESKITYYQESSKISDFNYCFYDTNMTGVIYIAETKDKDPVYAYDINKDIVYKTNKTHNLYTESNVSYLNAYLYGVELLKSVKSTGKMILVSEKIDVLNYTPSDTMEFVFANCIKGDNACTSTTYLFNNKEYSEVERYLVNFKTKKYTKVIE